jgi:hypothetical protein
MELSAEKPLEVKALDWLCSPCGVQGLSIGSADLLRDGEIRSASPDPTRHCIMARSPTPVDCFLEGQSAAPHEDPRVSLVVKTRGPAHFISVAALEGSV